MTYAEILTSLNAIKVFCFVNIILTVATLIYLGLTQVRINAKLDRALRSGDSKAHKPEKHMGTIWDSMQNYEG